MSKEIYRVRYRVGKEKTREAIDKICTRRIKELKEEHGENIKFSKVVKASEYPSGAPHVPI